MLSSFSAEARSQISVLSSFSAEARNGLETPAWWWWLGVAISAWWWLGVVISAWWWLGLADLDPPRPATTKERPTAWLSAQICNHRGHAVKHGPPRRDDPNGLEAPPRWFLVVGCSDLHGGFWLFRFPVVFGSDLHGSS
uniref:Uncharacterized protein n=1 Tax=Fagus sylvatica TaxID=28930 RepID=A0A2N9HKI8_FAGSY